MSLDQDGKIAYQGRPDESGLVPGNEAPEKQQDEETLSSSKEEKTSRASESSSGGTRNGEQGELDQPIIREIDMTRQTGDASVHKYYARAAGVKSTLVFVAALIVGASTDAFSRKSSRGISEDASLTISCLEIWLLWWTEAIADNPDTPTGKWLGVYAALGVIGIISNLFAGWFVAFPYAACPWMVDGTC